MKTNVQTQYLILMKLSEKCDFLSSLHVCCDKWIARAQKVAEGLLMMTINSFNILSLVQAEGSLCTCLLIHSHFPTNLLFHSSPNHPLAVKYKNLRNVHPMKSYQTTSESLWGWAQSAQNWKCLFYKLQKQVCPQESSLCSVKCRSLPLSFAS